MKRKRTFRSYLVLLAAVLLGAILALMTASMYGDSIEETQRLLLSCAQTNLNAAAYDISRELALIGSICDTIDTSPYVADLLGVYMEPEVSRVRLQNAYSTLKDTLNALIYRCDSIRAIYLQTPTRSLDVQKNYTPLVDAEEEVTEEIALRRGADGAYRLSFIPENAPQGQVRVVLFPEFMQYLLEGHEDVFIVDASGEILCPEGIDEAQRQALTQFLAGEKSTAIVKGNCLARVRLSQPPFDWDIVCAVRAGEYLSAYRLTIFASVAAYVLSFAAALGVGQAIARRVIRPLKRLISRVRRFRPEDATAEEPRGLGMREGVFLYSTITVSIGMALFLVFFSGVSIRIQARQRAALSEAMLGAVTESLEGTFEEMRDTVLKTAIDPRVSQYVKEATGKGGAGESSAAFEAALRENANAYSTVCTLSILGKNNEILYTSSYLHEVSPLKEAVPGEWRLAVNPFGQQAIALMIRIPEMSCNLYASYDYSVIAQQMVRLAGWQEGICLTDADLKPLDQTLPMLPADRYMTRSIPHTPWVVCLPYEETSLGEGILGMLREKAELVIAMLLAAVLLSSLLSSALLAPLSRLSASMRAVRTGGFSRMHELSRQQYAIDEMEELNESFTDMTEHIEELIDDLITSRNHMLMLENAKKNAEINALQMQITPHFISNTIMMIADRVKMGHSEEATEMLYAVNKLFRYGISQRDLVISLREEWAHAQAYAQIMMARRNNLSFAWSADEEALERSTIRLVLQPLLENAVYHGARKDGALSVVRVSCRALPETTELIVSDNGPGLSGETQERLAKSLRDEAEGSSIGLRNVQARIRMYCGEGYGIRFENEPEGGARFTLVLPRELEQKDIRRVPPRA